MKKERQTLIRCIDGDLFLLEKNLEALLERLVELDEPEVVGNFQVRLLKIQKVVKEFSWQLKITLKTRIF